MKRVITLILLLSAGSAFAHPGHGGSGFLDGLAHPLLGLDHWLAMLGLGLWARAARVPLQALATVAFGLAAGALTHLALPGVEPMLAASVLVAGLMGLCALRLPRVLGLGLAAGFSLVHGHAHGAELASGAAVAGAIGASLGLMALGALLGGDARAQKLAPGLVALAGAGMLAFA